MSKANNDSPSKEDNNNKTKDYFYIAADSSIADSFYKTQSKVCLEFCINLFAQLIKHQADYSNFLTKYKDTNIGSEPIVEYDISTIEKRTEVFIKQCDLFILAWFERIPYSVPMGGGWSGWDMSKNKIMSKFKEELHASYKEFYFLTEDYQKTIGIKDPINYYNELKVIANKIIHSIDDLFKLNPYKTENPKEYEGWKDTVLRDLEVSNCSYIYTSFGRIESCFAQCFNVAPWNKEFSPPAHSSIVTNIINNQPSIQNNSHVANIESRRKSEENKENVRG